MSGENVANELFLFLKGETPVLRRILDTLPCALVLWKPEHLPCYLNDEATQLTGFSDRDFREEPSLWMNRIHPRDRGLLSSAWKRLQGGEKVVCCDYRFFPNGDKEEIWLRDSSVSYQDLDGEVEGVASLYTDITDLKVRRHRSQGQVNEAKVTEIVDGLIHEMQNNLHMIKLGFDLLRLDRGTSLDSQAIVDGVDQASKSLQEIREYFLPPEAEFSTQDPAVILEDVVRQMEEELRREGIRLRMVHQGSLPAVRLDLSQFRSALERVMGFARALLPQGGELEVEAGLREIRGQRYVELKVASFSAISLGVEEKDVFRPFLRVNGHPVGLSIALARQVLRRHDGEVLFQKESAQRGLFTILLKVPL